MYKVSDEYIAAMRQPVLRERITGGIKLADGTMISVDDSVIVQGSLAMTRKAMNASDFDIGTANAASLKLKIRDNQAYDHDFGNALIKLNYGIMTGVSVDGSETWEEVSLPPFWVDGSKTTRTRNVVSLTASDPISRLTADKGTPPTTSLYSALQYFCNRCGVGIAVSESDFSGLPNSDVIPDFSSESISTCWDGVMWIAQTVNCCAFGDYRGLVQLKQYKYEGGDSYDRLFTANERTGIEYSDTRTYLAYLQSYVDGDVVQYSKVTSWTGSDAPHIKEGALQLPNNPILKFLTAEEQKAINQSYLDNRSIPTRYVKANGISDPAIEPLDVIAFAGGNIDIGQIISVATQIVWKYHGVGTITCASVSEFCTSASEELTTASNIEETSIVHVQPKSQLEKRVDELESKIGSSASSDRIISSNGNNYAIIQDSGNLMIFKDGYPEGYLQTSGSTIGFSKTSNRNFWLSNDGGISITNQADYDVDGYDTYVSIGGTGNVIDIDYRYQDSRFRVSPGQGVYISPGEIHIVTDTTNFRINYTEEEWEVYTQRSGNKLQGKSDGLYYNGKKVLTEE